MPAISGNRIVWEDNRNTGGGNYEIFINGTLPGDEYSLTPDQVSYNPVNPSISGNWVVWSQNNASDAANSDIFVNDTSTHQTFVIAFNRLSQNRVPAISFSPSQSLYRVVWDEQDASGYNVYLYTSGTSQTCPVASFSNDFAGGAAPATVHFTDTTSASPGNPVTHWSWDFGDGTTSTLQNPAHTYNNNIPYDVTLTVSNPLCRNTTTVTSSVVVGPPAARFSVSATTTVVNAPVTLTDNSIGSPTEWDWYWGDGTWTNGTTQNPQHAYSGTGTYSVTLVASNGYGSSTTTKINCIMVKPGANADESTNIAGITATASGSRQFLVYNYTTLPVPSLSPDLSTLTFTPPGSSGFSSIIITTADAGGFVTHLANTTITGNVSTVHLQTPDIYPTGFSATTGGQYCSLNYSFNLSTYPVNAGLNTQVWESSTGSDATNFNTIAAGSGFSGTNGTAYTTKITKTNFPSGATATLHMSLNATWVASKPYGRNEVYIERIDDSGTYGQVLFTRYVGHNATANLDYFEADSPKGLSTFGLSFLEGSGNLFQMVTLTVSSVIAGSSNQGLNGESGPGAAAVQATAVPQAVASPVVTPDTGKTAKLYFNTNNVITQATTLQSNDHYATLSIGEGTVVSSAGGAPPATVSLRALLPSDLPSVTGTGSAAYAGMAYDLGPGGTTFSPAVTLTFTNSKSGWGNVYTIRVYNTATQSWETLPTTYDPGTSTITAQVSHFCVFALFAEPVAAPAQKAAAPAGAPPKAAATPAPPAPTAVSTFAGLVAWLVETTYGHIYLAAMVVIAVIVVAFMRRRKPDPLL